MHFRGPVLLTLVLPGIARRSLLIDDFYDLAQRQNDTLTRALEVSGKTREALVPGRFGKELFFGRGPQAVASHAANRKGPPLRAPHGQPRSIQCRTLGPWRPFVPPRATVALHAAKDPGQDQLSPKEESSVFKNVPSAINDAFTMIDLDGDGVISDVEFRTFLRQYRFSDSSIDAVFSALDSDNSGGITLPELRAGIIETLGTESLKNKYTAYEADKIFDAVERDGSGSIDYIELREYLLPRGYTSNAIYAAFRKADTNWDSELSRAEFQAGFKKYALVREAVAALVRRLVAQKKWSPIIEKAFKLVDLNGDGVISDVEFRAFLGQYRFSDSSIDAVFSALDTDDSGGISLDELQEGLMETLGTESLNNQFTTYEADKIFEAMDRDGNGSIDYDELCEYLTLRGYTSKAIYAAFRSVGTNWDSQLSREEVREGFKKYSLVQQAVATLVTRLVMKEEWLPVIENAFTLIDLNSDCIISDLEFRTFLRQYRFTDSVIGKIFAAFDIDRSGSIFLDELRAAIMENMNTESFKQLYDFEALAGSVIFAAVDVDSKGSISYDELRQYLLSCGYTDLAVDAVFRSMDANSDGVLSRAEFQEGFKKYVLVRTAIGTLAEKLGVK